MDQELFGEGINKTFLNVLEKLNINNKNILSLGCGSAALESLLENKYGCKVIGIDLEEAAIKKAKNRISEAFVLNLEQDDLIKILANKRFDLILCADILEHLRNPDKIFEECKHLLNKDGLIVISIPNIANWSVRLNLLVGKFEYADAGLLDKTHVHFYTLKNLKELMKKNNYEIFSLNYSTSLVNITRSKLISLNTDKVKQNNLQEKFMKKSFLRKILKYSLEKADAKLTHLFPKLFAYQFIIVVQENR